MRSPSDLIQGYRKFRRGLYREQVDLYRSLGEGQNPDVMIIACADSRAEPAEIFCAAPGQLFVVRNVANLVPPYENSAGLHGVSAALEFAVTILKVKHIIVMGHGGCGGIAASLAAVDSEAAGEFLAPWVKLLDTARNEVLSRQPKDAQTQLELAGVEQSIANLMTFSFVRSAVEAGDLALHGSWFAIGSGELHWRNPKTGVFEVVDT